MFYYYTEVPSINHFLMKQQGKKIDLSGMYETIQNIFACFPEFYNHKMSQKSEMRSLVSGLGVSSLLLTFLKWSKFRMSIQTSFNKWIWQYLLFYNWWWSSFQEHDPPFELIHSPELPSWKDIRITVLLEVVCPYAGIQAVCIVLWNCFLKGQVFQAP